MSTTTFELRFAPPRQGEKCPYCDGPVQQTNGHGGVLYRCAMVNCGKWMNAVEVKSNTFVSVVWKENTDEHR